MKLIAAVIVGIFATFGFTIIGEFFAMNLRTKGMRLPFAELAVGWPLIAVMVGSLIGLIAKEKAQTAAALGIAPWIIFMALGAGRGHTAASWWVIMLTVSSIHLLLGIAAATLVGGRLHIDATLL